jgi:hypothetical protein
MNRLITSAAIPARVLKNEALPSLSAGASPFRLTDFPAARILRRR